MKICMILLFSLNCLFAKWQMFADKEDTYLYNTLTGEVYVKVRRGTKNYENLFVKMPNGVASLKDGDILETKPKIMQQKEGEKQEVSDELRLQSIKKAQEMIQRSLDTGGL